MSESILFVGKSRFLSLEHRKKLRSVLKQKAQEFNFDVNWLQYVFVSDEALLKLNQSALNHDTYTDIITFDLSGQEGVVEGEVYISIDRVRDNAEKYSVTFEEEYIRVMGHGLLHLLGFKDKTETDSSEMRKQENKLIDLYKNTN
jgi:probable rRNA maturation factor